MGTFQSFHSSVSVKPARPVRPVEPARPVRPAEPGEPVEPVEPVEPWSQWSPWSFRRALLEDVTTYQERLASHLTKMLRRIAGTSCLCVHRNINGITPPHPTPAVTDHERAVQCVCLQDSKKDDEVAVPDHVPAPCPQVLPQRYDSLVL